MSKTKAQQVSISLIDEQCLSPSPHLAEEIGELSGISYKGINSIYEAPPSQPNHPRYWDLSF